MSGAGRGTPRVSPSTGTAPEPPGGANPYGQIVPLTDAKFAYLGNGGSAQNLSAAFTSYTWADTGSGVVELPAGLTRADLRCSYTEGTAGGKVQLKVHWNTYAELVPTNNTHAGPVTVTTLRETVYEFSDTGGQITIPLSMSVLATRLVLEVAESGVPGTPGIFRVFSLRADNLFSNSNLGTITT